MSSSSPRGYLIALTATAVWSTTAIFIGYLTTRFHMPPLTLSFWRDLIVALALFVVITMWARPLLRLHRRDAPLFVLYGAVLAVFNALWAISVKLNGAAVATVLVHSAPIFTALVGRWQWGEQLGALKIGAIGLSLAGCALASGAYDPAAWQSDPFGIVVGLMTGAAFSAYSLMGKASAQRGVNAWTATLYAFAFAAAFLLLTQRPDTLLWLSQLPGGWREAALGWGTLALLAVGPTIGGYGLYTVSLTHLPATTANLIVTLEPALTALLAFCFLGESLTLPQLLGGGLILGGVISLRFSERPPISL